MEDWKIRLQMGIRQLRGRFRMPAGIANRLPPSVNNNPSNRVSNGDSGWGSSGASYDSTPQRMRQKQPFKWGQ